MSRPTIAEGWKRLAARGVARVVVTPLLLFSAGHAKRDIPKAIEAASQGTSRIPWTHTEPLNCHRAILELSARRFDEAVTGLTAQQKAEALLIMVGRGSLDTQATAEMHRFAALRQAGSNPAATNVAFIAMAAPRFTVVLNDQSLMACRHVIVQPHLLFSGLLLDELRGVVTAASERYPGTEWLIADRLGPDALLIHALVDQVVQTIGKDRTNGTDVFPVLEERV